MYILPVLKFIVYTILKKSLKIHIIMTFSSIISSEKRAFKDSTFDKLESFQNRYKIESFFVWKRREKEMSVVS